MYIIHAFYKQRAKLLPQAISTIQPKSRALCHVTNTKVRVTCHAARSLFSPFIFWKNLALRNRLTDLDQTIQHISTPLFNQLEGIVSSRGETHR